MIGLTLTVSDEAGRTVSQDEAATLYFHEVATAGWDAYDATKLKPVFASEYALLTLLGERAGEATAQAQDSRALALTEPTTFRLGVEEVSLGGSPAQLRWPRWQAVPETWQVELRDSVTGTRVDLRADSVYRFTLAGTGKQSEASAQEPRSLLAGPAPSERFELIVSPDLTTSTEDPPALEDVVLSPSYPNPFQGQTQLRYYVRESGAVRLSVFDVLGREVVVLVEGVQAPGWHEVAWVAAGLSSGLYVARLEAGATVRTRSVMLTR